MKLRPKKKFLINHIRLAQSTQKSLLLSSQELDLPPLPPYMCTYVLSTSIYLLTRQSLPCWQYRVAWRHTKGQLISKCLFGVFNSPKKRTKTIQLQVPIVVKSNFFRSFFGRIEDTKKTFRNELTFRASILAPFLASSFPSHFLGKNPRVKIDGKRVIRLMSKPFERTLLLEYNE